MTFVEILLKLVIQILKKKMYVSFKIIPTTNKLAYFFESDSKECNLKPGSSQGTRGITPPNQPTSPFFCHRMSQKLCPCKGVGSKRSIFLESLTPLKKPWLWTCLVPFIVYAGTVMTSFYCVACAFWIQTNHSSHWLNTVCLEPIIGLWHFTVPAYWNSSLRAPFLLQLYINYCMVTQVVWQHFILLI